MKLHPRIAQAPRTLAILYATWLGTVGFFVLCCILIVIGVAVPRLLLIVSFISQTVIQLLSLPAIQIQSIQSETQRQEDHANLMELVTEMHQIVTCVEAIEDALHITNPAPDQAALARAE